MKKNVILIVIVVLTIAFSITSFVIKNRNNTNKYETAIKMIANNFYEKKYYLEHPELIKKLSASNAEITFSLYDILIGSGYDEISIKQTNFYKKCDVHASMIRYRLKLPVEPNSFTLTMDLICN